MAAAAMATSRSVKQRQPLLQSPTPAAGNGSSAAGRRRFLTFLAVTAALVASYHLLEPTNSSRYHALFLTLGSNATAAAHLRALTLRPHVAGTEANAAAARYVLHAFSSLSFPAHITPYSVLLSYPAHRSLTLAAASGLAARPFSLVQETYKGDPFAEASAEVIPTYFAYSASGSVAAEVVYANYGHNEDYAYLASRGVDVAGKVALARYGRIHCEDIAHNARAAGAAAAVVYTDPLQYGGAPGEAPFPDSRWLPPSGVQVGSLFRGVGDPTTPMWASSDGCERLSVEEAMRTDDMPLIPALPVSARDAMEIHGAIGGAVAPPGWQGREDSPVYRLGPGPAVLNLTYLVWPIRGGFVSLYGWSPGVLGLTLCCGICRGTIQWQRSRMSLPSSKALKSQIGNKLFMECDHFLFSLVILRCHGCFVPYSL